MKELSNEEIEKLAGMIGNHSPRDLARLVGGDLSHIGRGILEGRKVRFWGGEYTFGVHFDFSRRADLYKLEPIPVKAMHYGDEVIEGLVRINWKGESKRVELDFSDSESVVRFISYIKEKEIK